MPFVIQDHHAERIPRGSIRLLNKVDDRVYPLLKIEEERGDRWHRELWRPVDTAPDLQELTSNGAGQT